MANLNPTNGPRNWQRAFQMGDLILTVHEINKRQGRFAGFVPPYGQVVFASRSPFLSAARALLKRGLNPNTLLTVVHAATGTQLLRGPIGQAAKLVVRETDNGPRFVEYRAFKHRRLKDAINDDEAS